MYLDYLAYLLGKLDNLVTNKLLSGDISLSNFKFKIQDILIQGGIIRLPATSSYGTIDIKLNEIYKSCYQVYVSPFEPSMSYYDGNYNQSYTCAPLSLDTIRCSHSNRESIRISWLAIGI